MSWAQQALGILLRWHSSGASPGFVDGPKRYWQETGPRRVSLYCRPARQVCSLKPVRMGRKALTCLSAWLIPSILS